MCIGDRRSLPSGIVFEAGGYLYAANQGGGSSIAGFAPGAIGNVAPVETIAGNPFAMSGRPDVATEEGPAVLYEYRQFGAPVGRHPGLAAIAALGATLTGHPSARPA